ncbi:hypothetical protein KOI40_18235, partial [Aestuariicella sp. G3-2]|uniref:beta strand repeat-containing protein n=1 Tax=Pseudomaricurvus albidus TaxID=2842452 RepID=UPI001C0AE9F1
GLEEANGAAGSSVLGTTGDDTFAASGEAGKVSQKGLTYSNITSVDAGTGTDTLTAGNGHIWSLTGIEKELIEDNITYSNMEVADANNATVQGADDAAEIFTVGGDANTVEISGLTFTNVNTVNGGSSSDPAINDVVESTTTRAWELTTNDNELIAADITFSDVEVAEHEGTVSGNSSVTGSGNADTFEIEGANTITANGVLISSIDTVDGGSNSGGNDVLTSSSAEAWQLSTDADVQVVHSGINFSGLEEANAATGSSVLGTSGDDTFAASGEAGKVSQKGLTYSNITSVDAGTGTDTLTAGNGHIWSLTGIEKQLIEDNITYSNMEVADANNASVQGADDAAEIFTVGGDANTVEVSGLTFTNVNTVNGGSSSDPAINDVVESTTTRAWELTTNDNELIAADITFSDVEVAEHEGTVSGNSSVTGSGNADTFEIEGANTITANGVLISSIDTVDGGNNSGGNDVLTSSSAEAWQLSTDADVQVVHSGINFSGLEEANAATGSSVLGTSGDDIFAASGEAGKVSQKGLTYSNITLVDAGTGIDTLTASDGHTWTLTG